MKLTLFDPYLLKFTSGMVKWWGENGYEVKYSRYYDPTLVKWADVIFFHTCDNNLKMATNPPKDNPDFEGYDMHDMDMSGKRVIVQPVDIECWHGHHLESKWDLVDEVVFLADHIKEMVVPDALPERRPDLGVHTIQLGLDLDLWGFAEREHGFDIAVVSEKWTSKGTDLILQIALKLKGIDSRYKIHWLGVRSDHPWEYAYFDDFVEHHDLNIEFTNMLLDEETVDWWLEGKNYLLHASHKEAFSAATAEAMAKGIKPVVHRFYGADNVWPGMTWDTIDQAIEEIRGGEYSSHSYRQYLIDKGYTLPAYMEALDKVIRR